MPKLKINLEITEKAYVIGISSNEKIYRLCWQMNNALDLALKYSHLHLNNDIVNQGFAVYKCDSCEEYDIYLLSNKYQQNYVSEKYKLFDFFIVCTGFCGERLLELQKDINKISSINTSKLVELKPKEIERFYIEE